MTTALILVDIQNDYFLAARTNSTVRSKRACARGISGPG